MIPLGAVITAIIVTRPGFWKVIAWLIAIGAVLSVVHPQ